MSDINVFTCQSDRCVCVEKIGKAEETPSGTILLNIKDSDGKCVFKSKKAN